MSKTSIAVLVAELHHGLFPNGGDEVISKVQRLHKLHLYLDRCRRDDDGVHQVSLPSPTLRQEQRVVGFG